jgi:hypothetical protein
VQGFHQRLGLGLADGFAQLLGLAADALLDRVDCGDPLDDLLGKGRARRLEYTDEVTARMREAEGERDAALGVCIFDQGFVGGIAVDLENAFEPGELRRDLLLGAAAGQGCSTLCAAV